MIGYLTFCASVALAQSPPAPPPVPPSAKLPVQITWSQKIPMRDGVKLSATIYRDPKQTKPVPAIVMLTPYIETHAAKQGVHFAQNGYVFVAIDLRGRGNSEGVFVPGQVEAKDGYDAIEWAAKQPWCDGQVATWGGSWLGFTQWSIAKEFPPHLKAIAPSASVHPGVDYPQPHGIFMTYMLQWLTYVHGRGLNQGLFTMPDLWINNEYQQVRSGRAFRDLDELSGIKGTVFRTWAAHPREDAFWQAMTPRPEHYAKFRIPILTITGHYDGDQLGALTYYDRHMAHGAKDATARHWLVIGPWDHFGTRRPSPAFGGLTFAPNTIMSMEELHTAWYDHVLKGGPRPAFLKDRVALYISGRDTWIYASDLKQIESTPLTLALDVAGANPGDITRSGRLSAQAPAAAATVALTADPKYLPPQEKLLQDGALPDPPVLVDQEPAYRDLRSKIVLHSAPFAAETVLAGRPRLRLQVASDQPDADLWVDLYEVRADGTSVRVASSSIRLRYRAGGVTGAPMTPGKPERIDLPPLDFFARSIAKGSRLRLVVDAGPQFGWQRNSHTGGDLVAEPASKGRVAKISIMTGPGTGSALVLPRPEPALLKAKEEPAKK